MKYIDFGFIFLIIGAIIGAGFSSGKEIIVFFSGAGNFSYILIFLITLFLYIVLSSLIKLGQNIKPSNIKDINKILFKKSAKFFDIFILVGLFIFITAMVAGLNSIGSLIFENINFPILTIISLFFAFFIVLNGYDAIKYVNNFLMPIVIAFIVFISIYSLFIPSSSNLIIPTNFSELLKYLSLGVCYISYNIVFSSGLIVEKSKDFSNKKSKINSIIISLLIGFLIFIINTALLKGEYNNFYSDLPMLNIAFNISETVGYMFGFILWFSVLTSLISSLYMLVNAFKMNKYISCAIFLTLSFILSFFGFSCIVNFLYPLQGLIGLIFIFKTLTFNRTKTTGKVKSKTKKGTKI